MERPWGLFVTGPENEGRRKNETRQFDIFVLPESPRYELSIQKRFGPHRPPPRPNDAGAPPVLTRILLIK